MRPPLSAALSGALFLAACSSEDPALDVTPGSGGASAAGGASASGAAQGAGGSEECADGCVGRHEPADRVDFNNVVSYGGGVLTLDLPDPPKSGFRLVVPPRTLAPGDEVETCHAWAYPPIQNRAVYAARVYTTGALHHSNVYGVPIQTAGRSPYPACQPGQGDVFTQVPNFASGNIMDVLFANSTQIAGGEQLVLPEGMAFQITTDGREVATSIHWINVADHELTSEIVYDFYTRPIEDVETEVVPFVFENQGFVVEAQTQEDITTTCDLIGEGNIVTIMPHTHKRAKAFSVDLIREDGTESRIFEDGAFDTDSEITVFDQPIALSGFGKIRHRCTVDNDLSRDIVWGIGDDEMCTLFGYLYPPSAQLLGYVGRRQDPNTEPTCLTLPIGKSRP